MNICCLSPKEHQPIEDLWGSFHLHYFLWNYRMTMKYYLFSRVRFESRSPFSPWFFLIFSDFFWNFSVFFKVALIKTLLFFEKKSGRVSALNFLLDREWGLTEAKKKLCLLAFTILKSSPATGKTFFPKIFRIVSGWTW